MHRRTEWIGDPIERHRAWTKSDNLFTLWDVVNTLDIEHLVTALRQLAFGHAGFQHWTTEKMDAGAMTCVCNAVHKCVEPFRAMGFKTSAGMMDKFLSSAQRELAHQDWTGAMFAERCHAVFSAIQCETVGVLCFKLDDQLSSYFERKTPFGGFVAAAFPECGEDIDEAHQCIAFERYTAAMFHVGRAMEIAVKRVAKKMQAKATRDEWQSYLTAMNTEIGKMPFKTPAQKAKRQIWAEAAGHLFNFKESWRNPTFHAKKTYTPTEALAVLSNAGQFMDYAARKVIRVTA
jgi:hypothetical protein